MIDIPELDDGSKCWVVMCKKTLKPLGGFYHKRQVEKFSPQDAYVLTGYQYICFINAEEKEKER